LSRTDKTKPFWVKIADGDLKAIEAHNHTGGVCDLPDPHDAFAFTRLTTQCRREFIYTGVRTCCCPLCSISGWHETQISAAAANAATYSASIAIGGRTTSEPLYVPR
jgi:hypothetical protein